MSYRVNMDISPIYEFIASFMIFTTHRWANSLDLGKEWTTETRSKLLEEESVLFEQAAEWPLSDFDILFAWVVKRKPKMRVDDFLSHLQQASSSQLVESISDLLPTLIEEAAETIRTKYLPLFYIWQERYFRFVEAAHEVYLREDVLEKQTLQNKLAPKALIEIATSGNVVGEHLPISEVVLLPTLHLRPLNTYCFYNNTLLFLYPVDFPDQAGQPPNVLLRLTRALADPERLKLLRFLAGEAPKTMDEIKVGLPETGDRMFNHLMMLRVAGLLRIHIGLNPSENTYSLRKEGTAELGIFLESYIQV